MTTEPFVSLPVPAPDWPESWQEAHRYDRQEVGGETELNRGYAAMYRARREATLAALERHVTRPARILDLAAASGNFTIAAARAGYDVVWNDLRAEMADYVRLKARDLPIEYVAGNIFELGEVHRGAYDGVLALEVIEHVAHPDRFLAQIASLLRPGGHLIVSTPNGRYLLNDLPRFSDHPDPSVFESVQFKPNSDGHIFLLHEDEMRRFGEENGLEVVEHALFANPLTCGHLKLRHALAVLPTAMVRGLEAVSRRTPALLRDRILTGTLFVYHKQ